MTIQKSKCKYCNGKKVASYLPDTNIIVYPGYETKAQKQIYAKLEEKPCLMCVVQKPKGQKIIKSTMHKRIVITKNDNINGKGKRSAKKNHS